MRRPPELFLYLTCLFMGKMAQMNQFILCATVYQESGLITATVGDSLALKCLHDSDAAKYYWYKQSLGQRLQLICVTYKFDKNGTFHGEFKDNPRFALETKLGMNQLHITDLQLSDSATYYCARGYSFMFEFAEGTVVSVKGSGMKIQASVLQSESEIIQPGGSVTLNCTVHTESCDGGHSVYWFRDSVESSPGLIYTHGDRNDQCERKPDTQTHTCVYNLPMTNLNHSGTYYCAVASCGRMLFGNGTKLDLDDEEDSLFLVYFLSGALAFTTILSVILAFIVYKMSSRTSSESHVSSSPEGVRAADDLHYAALNVQLPKRSRRERDNNNTECVYSRVRQ